MENCFWREFQASVHLPCVVPSLLPNDVNMTKPECEDPKKEDMQRVQLNLAIFRDIDALMDDCRCVQRCSVIDYHISGNPTSSCDAVGGYGQGPGNASLYVAIPSNRVRSPSDAYFIAKIVKYICDEGCFPDRCPTSWKKRR